MSELLRHRGGSQPTFAPSRSTGHMIREGYPTDGGAKRPVPTEEMKWAQSLQPGHGALIAPRPRLAPTLTIHPNRRTNSTCTISGHTPHFLFTVCLHEMIDSF